MSPLLRRPRDIAKEPNTLRIISVILFFVAWQLVGMNVDPLFLPTPVAVGRETLNLLTLTSEAFMSTMSVFSVGFLLGVAAAIPMGILIGRYEIISHLSDIELVVFYSLPSVAFLPLFILWLGVGFEPKVAIVFISVFFPTLINTETGVKNVDRPLVDMFTVFGANEREIMRKLILPSSVPFIVAGLRIAIARGVVGAVVAEMFTAITGLGGLINYYGNTLESAKMFVPLIFLAIVSLVFTAIVRQIEKKAASWRLT